MLYAHPNTAAHRALALIFFYAALVTCPVFAQLNLVPNPGFDSLSFCPTSEAQIKLAYPWQNGVLTPDLYNECSTHPSLQTPNPQGCNYLPPKNGGGYIGMYVYFSRELAETTLLQPLERGKQYYARFFVAPDENCNSGWEQSFTDAIALGIRVSQKTNSNYKLVAETSGTIINDTSKWTKVSGCFWAEGKEDNLRIGNFKTDAETLVEPPNDPFGFNYMFVDDLFLGTFDPFPDTVVMCPGQPLRLDATFLEAKYLWSTGDTSALLIASDTGRYVVHAVLDGCDFREEVVVVSAPPTQHTALADTSLCDAESIVLTAPLVGSYRWSDGSSGPRKVVSTPGAYRLTVTNSCGEFYFSQQVEAETCRCQVFVPNVFSPNDDGSNDALTTSIGCKYAFEVEQFAIYDRWGSLVFASKKHPVEAWNGYIGQRAAPPGVYTWCLTYKLLRNNTTRKITEYGDLTLLR